MKKIILIIGIFYLCFASKAQVVNLAEDYEKAQAKYDSGDYSGTVAILEKIIPEVEQVYQDTTSFYEMMNMMGLSLIELKKYKEGESYLTKSTSYYTNSAFDHPNNFIAQVTLAQLYYAQGNYSKAEINFKNSTIIEGKTNGEKTKDYIVLIQNLANTYTNLLKFQSVDSVYQKLIPITKEVFGENSHEYAVALKNRADLLRNLGKNTDAVVLYLSAKQIIKNTSGAKNKEYLSILNNLASIAKQQQQMADAENYYDEMADIYRSNNGVKSEEYATCINNLAILYKSQNKFDQAEKLLERTLKSYKSSVGEKNILYINTLSSLGSLYRATGQYNKSESTYLECKKILFETFGEKNINYADLLNNTALLYEEIGKYDIAESYLTQSLTITKDVLTDKNAQYATTLNNLASLYKTLGNYEKAEPMFKQSLSIRKEVVGENHPDYGASLNNLAEFYVSVNRKKEAEPLFIQASQITKKIYGEQHRDYALCLNNLANLYEETEQYNKAEQNYNQSLGILKNVLGETHAEYASTLNNLAFLYLETKKYKEAEELFKKDLEIIKKTLGINHPHYAKSLSNLGDLYEHTGKYIEAEKNYLEALKIRKEKLGEFHPDYTYTAANIARVYTATKKYAEAMSYWKIAINNYKEEIKKYFPSMSEREKENFYSTFKDRFEQFNSFATSRYTTDPEVISEMYNMQLTTKALLFNSSNKVRQRILNSNDITLIDLYKKWQTEKELLAQLYTLPKNEITINIDSLERKTNETEKELSLKSELFKSTTETQNYTWQDIQKTLKPGEAAVEIIRFRKYKADLGGTYVKYKFEGKEERDSVYYVALIITTETKDNPTIVLMKNGTDLENRYIAYYKNAIKFNVDDQFCYANYWSQISLALGNIKKVYFSPDGIYNNINLLSILNPATKQFIIDEVEIYNVTNTKDLLTIKPVSGISKKVFLMGDPDFNGINTSGALRSGKLNQLPGSGAEVQKIDAILKNNNWASSLYTGNNSTEDILKSVKDARIIHIATHGFFEKDGDGTGKSTDNPLMKSGLYLSTGNKNSKEDGILRAYEAMNLNLDNTELVVLSACETGLGEQKNGEGVYGLQRAFRVAGARSIIISLWKVDDIATQKLMSMFYEEWLKIPDKRKAFTVAQNKLRKEYKDPMYWGAFIIVGE